MEEMLLDGTNRAIISSLLDQITLRHSCHLTRQTGCVSGAMAYSGRGTHSRGAAASAHASAASASASTAAAAAASFRVGCLEEPEADHAAHEAGADEPHVECHRGHHHRALIL